MQPGRKPLKRLRKRTEFSKVLTILLHGYGMSPSELARGAGIHRSLPSRILTGTTYMVDGEHVAKIAGEFPRRRERAQLLAAYARDCLAACGTQDAALVRVTVTPWRPAKTPKP